MAGSESEEIMKAISLWQPWASAMAEGIKKNETRSWFTPYRGDLVICSAKRKPTNEEVGDAALHIHAMTMPYGFALCVVELYGIVPTSNFHREQPTELSEAEADLGDYTPGRFAWLTRHLRTLRNPVPIVGRQSLWDLPPESEALIMAQL